MRKFLIGLAGIVVLLVAAALVVPGVIDWNRYKGDIAAEVKAATGRDLVIRGNLDLAVLPAPHLSVSDVRFASVSGAAEPEMVKLKSLDVRVRFLPLLRGRVEVASVTLVEPVIVLEKLADGRTNWDFAPAARGGAAMKPAPGKPAAGPAAAPGGAEAFRLDMLRIRKGTLVWRDAAAGSVERIEKLDADIQARSLAGPFEVKGTLTAHGVPLALTLAVGRLVRADGPAPVSLSLSLPGADAKAELTGTLAGVPDAVRFTGKIETSGGNLARLVAAASGTGAQAPLPPMLAQPFALKARVTGTTQGGGLSDLDLELGGAHATGEVTAAVGERVRIDARLKAGRIDLNRWLAPPPAAATPSGAKPSATGDEAARPVPAAADPPFSLPAGVNASLDLTVLAVTYGGEAVQDIRLNAQLVERALTLRQASLRLPGGGEASLTGTLSDKGGRPAMDGTLEVRADNLRALFQWLKMDIAGVPADRLRKFALSAKLRGDDRQLQVLGAKVSLDTSRIDAGITFALRRRLAFGASLSINQINLDAYMPAEPAKPVGAPAAPASPAPAPGPATPARGPLAVLDDFDANLRVQVGSLTVRRTSARNIRFDGTLSQGSLAIRDASVGNLAGTAAQINGTLTGFAGVPVFRGGFSADSSDISGIMRIVGLEPPAAARSLGTVRLRGKADGGADKVALDATLDLAGGKVTLAGTVDGLPAAPRFDVKLGADSKNPARLARAFGVELPAEGKSVRPLSLDAALKGDMKALTADARLKAMGADVAVAGTVSGLASAPVYEGTLKASHPSYNALMAGIAPGYRPAATSVGPVRIEASLKGAPAGAELTALKVQAGKLALDGSGRLALDGPRPKLVASFTGNDIDLNPFLPPPAAEKAAARKGAPVPAPAPGGAAPAGGRFSSEPFDLAALGTMDADLSVGASAIVWRQFRVDKPTVKMTLADGLLTAEQVAGRMFDGSFLLKGTLNAKGRPAVAGTVTVQKANVGKALFEAAAFDVAGGILDFDMAVSGNGASPRAMVAALDGQGRMAVQNGTVKGFDLKAVSDRLKNIDRGLDILRLFGAAMGGGETKFTSLGGTFQIGKGVLRTSDLMLVAQAGEGTAAGFADLPRWTMDFTARFRLTEHPNAPPFGMVARGPIDNPQRIFKVEQLQNYLLQRGVGSLLRKLVPDKRQPQTQAPATAPAPAPAPAQVQPPPPSEEPRKMKPEDILRGLLKGLGR